MVKLAEFLASQGMDYSVSKVPAMHRDLSGNAVETPGQFHLQRSSDGLIVSPKTVSKEYNETDPTNYTSRIEHYISEGWITPHKGHVFMGGIYEVVSFKIDGGQLEDKGKVIGEEWDYFLSFHNFHGGRGKVKGKIDCKRLRCTNGAYSIVSDIGFSLPHHSNLSVAMDAAVKQWEGLRKAIRRLADRMTVWNETEISLEGAKDAIAKVYGVFGLPEDEVSTRKQNEIDFAISEFSNLNRGTYGRSLADVYNAITATQTHYVPNQAKDNPARRLESQYSPVGTRHVREAKAVALLDRMAGIQV